MGGAAQSPGLGWVWNYGENKNENENESENDITCCKRSSKTVARVRGCLTQVARVRNEPSLNTKRRSQLHCSWTYVRLFSFPYMLTTSSHVAHESSCSTLKRLVPSAMLCEPLALTSALSEDWFMLKSPCLMSLTILELTNTWHCISSFVCRFSLPRRAHCPWSEKCVKCTVSLVGVGYLNCWQYVGDSTCT